MGVLCTDVCVSYQSTKVRQERKKEKQTGWASSLNRLQIDWEPAASAANCGRWPELNWSVSVERKH